MKHRLIWMALPALACSISAAASPMSYAQLETCAGYAQKMRADAPALVAQDRHNAELREHYNAGNGTQNEKLVFNQRMAQYRRDVVALNSIKHAFHEQCAGRSVRQSDVARLPPALQDAWRQGLDDIEVPYLGPSETSGAR